MFRRLLLKLTMQNSSMFALQFYKQTDGCTMGGHFLLSVIYIYIYIYIYKIVNPLSQNFVNVLCMIKKKRSV